MADGRCDDWRSSVVFAGSYSCAHAVIPRLRDSGLAATACCGVLASQHMVDLRTVAICFSSLAQNWSAAARRHMLMTDDF